jgi:NAD(P)H-dependent flavin oxidoreductase YrpB (nitropropane dioxygenase family)
VTFPHAGPAERHYPGLVTLPWELPVMQAPIGPATTTELVTAVSRVGALGTLAASWTDPQALRQQLQLIHSAVGRQFCVNLVLDFDQEERLDVVLDEGAGFVSFSWGVDRELIERAQRAGVVVIVQIGDVPTAREAADAGADILIAQGVEAGGHVQGTTRLREFLDEIRPMLDLPIIAAGGIADGASARAAVNAGANGVACGTAFLASTEADVHPDYFERLLRATSADSVLTTVFDIGWPDAPHRVLRNETLATWESAGRPAAGSRPGEGDVIATRARRPVVRYSNAQPTTDTEGDIGSMALYAGTSVDSVRRRVSAVEIARGIARDISDL